MTPALLSLILGFQSRNPIEPKAVIVYDHAVPPFAHAQNYEAYTRDYLEKLTDLQYTVLEDPNGQFKVIVSDDAFHIYSLEMAGSFFQTAGKLGLAGFDSSTELGKQAISFIRGYDPFIDVNKPLREPLIHSNLNLYINVNGSFSSSRLILEIPPTKQGFADERDDALDKAVKSGEQKIQRKGPVIRVSEPYINPHQIRIFSSPPKISSYESSQMLEKAHELVMERFASAIESYRVGMDSYMTSMIDKYLGNLANQLPGEISINDLPEDAKRQLQYQFENNFKNFGFNSKEEALEYYDKNGKITVAPRIGFNYDTKNRNDYGKRGVGVVLSYPTKPK